MVEPARSHVREVPDIVNAVILVETCVFPEPFGGVEDAGPSKSFSHGLFEGRAPAAPPQTGDTRWGGESVSARPNGMGREAFPVVKHSALPLPGPLHELKPEPPIPKRRDQQAPPNVGRIGLLVAGPTQGHELIQVEIRAAGGALEHMVDVQPGAAPAGLADPARLSQDIR